MARSTRSTRSDYRMANAGHRSILVDHQMIVDGVPMRETEEWTINLNVETGDEEIHMTRTRVIGERSYTAKKILLTDSQLEIETDMDDSELENFMNEWEEKWISLEVSLRMPLSNFEYSQVPNKRVGGKKASRVVKNVFILD